MKYVYVMGSTRYWFRYKIGISNDVKFRAENISKSIKGDAYVIFSAKYFYAENVEILMHQIYRSLSAKMHGSGKTEWFWLILPVSPIILLCLIWFLQRFAIIVIPIVVIWAYFNFSSNGKNSRNRGRNSPAKTRTSAGSRITEGWLRINKRGSTIKIKQVNCSWLEEKIRTFD